MALDLTKPSSSSDSLDKVAPVISWLNENYEVRINSYDTTQTRIVSKQKKYDYPITLNDIRIHMLSDALPCSDSLLRMIVTSRNQMRSFNPIEEYFNMVRGTYKGSSHIDFLAAHIKVVDFGDKPANYYNLRAIKLLKKWMVAACACALGKTPNDVQMVFVQEQEGTGKTTLSEFLCPPELKEMLTRSSNDPKVFNIEREFSSNFFVFFDEFIGLQGNNNAETFKSTMSAREMKIKTKNDPFPVVKPRIASGIATSNNKTGKYSGFLTRSLGTRRFAIIHIEELKDYRGKIDINQIWAEALLLCEGDTDFDYIWNQDDFAEFREFNVRYLIETPATVLISQNYRVPNHNEDGDWMQPQDIIRDLRERRLLKSEFIRDITPERVGEALMALGFTKKPRRIRGIDTPRYCYHIVAL